MMLRLAVSAGLALGAVHAPTSAAGQVPAAQPLSAAEAGVELAEAEAALEAAEPQAAEPTAELRDLVLALPALQGAERRRARALLARPPDGNDPVPGASWGDDSEADKSPICEGNFCVHWSDSARHRPPSADGNDNDVPDYVEDVMAFAQISWQRQNMDLRWPRPKSDGDKGQGPSGESQPGNTDIYLSDICATDEPGGGPCYFGYAAPDDGSRQCRRGPFRCFAYMVLDNDYKLAEFGYADPEIPLKATLAHEYNHVLQFRLDAFVDLWMFESTATWMEEQVFPGADDWHFFARPWARQPQQPITSVNAGGGLRIYGSAVWNHWLERGGGYGAGVVLDAWKATRQTTPKHFAAAAYNRAIKRGGGAGFAQEFGRFAAATAEWRVRNGNFPDQAKLRDVRRQGTLRRGAGPERFVLNHTAYRLLRVKPRRAGAVTLRVRAPRGVRTAIALVGRRGRVADGAVTQKLRYLPRGRRGGVRLRGARRFNRVTAVVANTDPRLRGAGGFDWAYAADGARFKARIR